MCYLSNRKKQNKNKTVYLHALPRFVFDCPYTKRVITITIIIITIKLLHSRSILILGNSKRGFNMSTIKLKLHFARQQFAEARIKVLSLLATITTPAYFAVYLSLKLRLTKNNDQMIIVDSLGFYYRSHNRLKKHKQRRFSTEGRNYRKHYWFRTWFFRKMQHSFFTNFTQTLTDAWRQIQLRICILFFQASIRNCKNCVHNEDHSLFDFHIRDSRYNIIWLNV